MMKKGFATAAVLALLASVFTGLASGADVAKEDGTAKSGEFGPGVPAGWDYAKVKSPSGDAWVAVLWGKGNTDLTKGSIWIIGMWTRTFGGAKVYDQNGALIAKTKPLAVRAYFMQRFDAIYEFNDTNGDGIANVVRANKPITKEQVLAHEPVYKAASMRASWEKTNASETTVTEDGISKKVWELTLTAKDLPYIVIGDPAKVNQSVGDWKLNSVSFTFHLKGWKETANVSIPLYNITVDKSKVPPGVNVTSAGTKNFSANITKVKAKEDHEFVGWDFDPSNSKPGLVLETHVAFGYFIKSGAAAWISQRLIEKDAKAAGKVSYRAEGDAADTEVDGGSETLPDADGDANTTDTVKKVGGNRRIEFAGNWDKSGFLTWVADTKVWANETASPTAGTVNFQVQGARRFAWDSPLSGVKMVGVLLMGGFSYAGGPFYKVRHDPETETDMGEVEVPDQDNNAPSAKVAALSRPAFTTADTVALNATGSSDPDGDALSYTWSEGGTTLGTTSTLSQKFAKGAHTVNLTVSDGGATSTTSVTFTVKDAPAKKKQPGFEGVALLAAIGVALVLLGTRRKQ